MAVATSSVASPANKWGKVLAKEVGQILLERLVTRRIRQRGLLWTREVGSWRSSLYTEIEWSLQGPNSGRGRRIERELSGYFNYWWLCDRFDSDIRLRNGNQYLLSRCKGDSMYILFSRCRRACIESAKCIGAAPQSVVGNSA